MKILGVSTSARKMGNSEIMVKHALKHLQSLGHEVNFVRVSKMTVNACIESYLCNFKSNFCSVSKNDDFMKFTDEINRHDAIIWGIPTLIWLPPGIIKLMADRSMYAGNNTPKNKKQSLVLISSGVEELSNLVEHMIEPMFLGFHLNIKGFVHDVGNFTGPGEVCLRPKVLLEIEAQAENLVSSNSDVSSHSKKCPACGFNLLIVPKANSMSCAFCATEFQISSHEGVYSYVFDRNLKKFDPEEHLLRMVNEGRKNIKESYSDLIKAKKKYYDENLNIPIINVIKSQAL